MSSASPVPQTLVSPLVQLPSSAASQNAYIEYINVDFEYSDTCIKQTHMGPKEWSLNRGGL